MKLDQREAWPTCVSCGSDTPTACADCGLPLCRSESCERQHNDPCNHNCCEAV